MRWTALVVAVLACGCGDGGGGDAAQADTAPACDLPPMVCEDGSAAVPLEMQPERYEMFRCFAGGRDPVQSWTVSRSGTVTHHIAGTESTTCWTATSTVAVYDTYDGAEVTRECWARDGERADCSDVEAELFELAK